MKILRRMDKWHFGLALLLALSVGLLWQPSTARADSSAGDFETLAAAITAANADPGRDTITLTANITLTGNLPLIVSAVTVEGNGHFVSGNDQYRVFFVGGGITETAPTVTFRNLTIQHGRARGGMGGGGGAGLGGGLFIYSGTVATENVLFAANQALGGIGGAFSGGGGMGGDGGEYPLEDFGGGGGGGGLWPDADGGWSGGFVGYEGGNGEGLVYGGGGGGGGVHYLWGSYPGGNGGGQNGGTGADGSVSNGGGGGINGSPAATDGLESTGGNGGWGGGGGGGGLYGPGAGGAGGFGGGGGGSSTGGAQSGGVGGFGGGGGGAAGGTGGAGGFGGGGGLGYFGGGENGTGGAGGFGGGAGATDYGGGGAGFGGGVFVRAGTLTLQQTTFQGNYAGGGYGSTPGQGKGGGLFICAYGAGWGEISHASAAECNARVSNASSGVTFSDNTAADDRNAPTDNDDVFGLMSGASPSITVIKSNFAGGAPYSFGPTLVSVTLSLTDTGALTVTKHTACPGGTCNPGELPATWHITSTLSAGLPLTVSFCYTPELSSVTDAASLRAFRWDTDTLTWTVPSSTSLTVDDVNHCIILTGITEFSAWTLKDTSVGADKPTAARIVGVAARGVVPLLAGLLLLGGAAAFFRRKQRR